MSNDDLPMCFHVDDWPKRSGFLMFANASSDEPGTVTMKIMGDVLRVTAVDAIKFGETLIAEARKAMERL